MVTRFTKQKLAGVIRKMTPSTAAGSCRIPTRVVIGSPLIDFLEQGKERTTNAIKGIKLT